MSTQTTGATELPANAPQPSGAPKVGLRALATKNIGQQYSYVLILAIGMLIVILSGHIDLSVGSLLGLAGAVSAFLVIKQGMPWWTGMLAALAVGLIAGAWQ